MTELMRELINQVVYNAFEAWLIVMGTVAVGFILASWLERKRK